VGEPILNRFVYVSASDEQARRELERAFAEFIADYAPDLRAALEARYGEGPVDYGRVVEDFCLFGSPATVRARLLRLRDVAGIRRLIVTLNYPTVELALCRRSMELFAREVMPALQVEGPVRMSA